MEFIPVAEETGMIIGMGAQACRQMHTWRTISQHRPDQRFFR